MKKIRTAAVIMFGLIFPCLMLTQAYLNIQALTSSIENNTTTENLINQMGDVKKHLVKTKDYALFSLLLVENANLKTMSNKQVLKTSIIKIGFAVISVGMMLIILGFQEDEKEGEGGGDQWSRYRIGC